jgi:hypothetical protein
VKGPSGRARFDLRRHWLCPVCQAKRWTGGHIVNLRCPRCAAHNPPRETWMHLVEVPRPASVAAKGAPPPAPEENSDTKV